MSIERASRFRSPAGEDRPSEAEALNEVTAVVNYDGCS